MRSAESAIARRVGPLQRLSAWWILIALLPGVPARAVADHPVPTHPQLERGVFLIAKSGLNDPNFGRSVILITRYDESGTTGLLINRALPIPAADAIPSITRLGLDPGDLHVGGPVAAHSVQLLIRAGSGLDEKLRIFEDVFLVSEPAELEDLVKRRVSGSAVRLYAGYAGWGPGQLESELLRGDWYLWPADIAEIFTEPPESIWPRLIQLAAAQWALRSRPVPQWRIGRDTV